MVTSLLHRNGRFRLLVVGQSVSLLGDPLLPFALAYSALRTGNGSEFGWLLAARSAGALIFSLVGGTLADQHRQTRVMAACDAARLLFVLAIGAALLHHATLVTAVLVFLFSSAGVFFGPALSSALPRIVGDEDLQRANGMLAIAKRTSAFAGPAIGALLVEVIGLWGVVAVDAATFVVSSLCFILIRVEPSLARTSARFAARVREGFAALRGRRWLTEMILLGLVQIACCLAPWIALLPVTMSGRHYSTGAYGACLSLFAAGNVAGSFFAMRIRTSRPGVVAQLVTAPFAITLIALGLHAPFTALLMLHFVAGVGTDICAVLYMTALQRDVPREVIGRVAALDSAGSVALSPFAYAAIGLFGNELDPARVLVVGGIIGVLVAVVPLIDPQIRAYSSRSVAEPLVVP